MSKSYEQLYSELKEAGQEHCLKHYDSLSDADKEALLKDLSSVDFKKLNSFFIKAMNSATTNSMMKSASLEPVPKESFFSTKWGDEGEKADFYDSGLKAISEGKVGLLLLAGGQGTRLGTTKPKGMYDVGLPSGKSLYQLQAERLLKIQQLAEAATGRRGIVPWYIMASESTKGETENFLQQNNYFRLSQENVVLFEQNTQPCVTLDGKIIMATPSKVSRAPDGNGGLYSALNDGNVLADMEKRGIQYIHVYCVDNILVRVADPVFIGYCIDKQADCAAKSVAKRGPTEPVGIICLRNGKYQVVEYSEISDETAQSLNENGSLKFNCGNIANHFFHFEFLKRVCANHEDMLVHHIAKKKIPTIDDKGAPLAPVAPNGIKLELFIFDVFPHSTNMAVLEVSRREEFSPLKNKPGSAKDCPETCKKHLMKLHRQYIAKAGGDLSGSTLQTTSKNEFTKESDTEEETTFICEISPLVSYAGEGLEAKVNGKSLSSPVILD
eukprot:Nk52_evm14s1129 gene=Nk52_evmTU14s1129